MKRKSLMVVLSILAAVYIVPVIVTVIQSLRYGKSLLTLRQYGELFITDYTAMYYFWNSMLYAVVVTVFCILLSFPLGFLFAKVTFWGRDALFFLFILVMLLPFQATLLPNYIQLRDLGLLNTCFALMIPMVFSPFAVFLFRQFISGIPDELLEYTTLETSSVLRLLWYVVLPQIKEAVAALAVLIFCECWNMVEQPVVFTPEAQKIWPLSVMLTMLPKDVVYAGATVYLYPVIIVFFLFHNTLQKSMEKFKW